MRWKLLLIVLSIIIGVSFLTAAASGMTADFSADETTGSTPFPVQFTDTSSDTPTGWAWFFGDETYTALWTQQTAGAGWPARIHHSSVAMPDGSIVLTGGTDNGGNLKNDVWRSSDKGITWIPMNASAAWSARSGHSSVAMPDGSIVLMGGTDNSGNLKNDVWRSSDNGVTWMQMTAGAGWPARIHHTSVVTRDGSIVLMGGLSGGNHLNNDVWRSADNGATWTQMTAGAGWSARDYHSSVAMPDGSIVLMGGDNTFGSNLNKDVWRSPDNGATWTQMTASAGWSARYGQSSVAMPDGSIVLMGGYDGSYKNDIWRSTDSGATWTRVTPGAGWSVRYGQTSVTLPDGSIVLIGGWVGSFTNDVWRLIPTGSLAQNPTHTYTTPGTYQVTLQAYNAAGYTSTRKTGYITVLVPVAPAASFTGVPRSGTVPFTVQFNDTSAHYPSCWNWSFGDATWYNTTARSQRNVSHTYTSEGSCTVTLFVSNVAGSDTSIRAGYITVYPPAPVADFAGTPTSGTAPLTVQFNDTSTGSPTIWNWSFGDTTWFNTSARSLRNANHTYTNAGTYTITLIVSNAGGSDTKTSASYITVYPPPPVADFTGTPPSGTAPLTVQFNDTSLNSPTSWNWSFGDTTWFNTTTRSQRNATHTYTNAGTYSVTLHVRNTGGYNSTQKIGYIVVTPAVASDRIGVFSNGAWYLDANGNGVYDPGTDKAYGFGAPGVLPVTGDWNADGTTKVGFFIGGTWYLDYNGNGIFDNGADRGYAFGAPGFTPVTGDWNADNRDEIGFFINGSWYLDTNGNGLYDPGIDRVAGLGANGYTPLAGNWNGDGTDDIGIFINGAWYLDYNNNGVYDAGIDRAYGFGAPGVLPVTGDWNGDGKTEIGFYIDGTWYLDYNGNGVYDPGVDKGYAFGAPGFTPVTGDWNADNKDEIGFFTRGSWYLDYNGNGLYDPGADKVYGFGAPGYTPLVGKWS